MNGVVRRCGRLYKNLVKEVFEQNYEWFRRFLRGRFINLSDYDIEDLVQQAALKLLYRGENIAGIKNLTSYVYRTLENAAKDYFRKRGREAPGESAGEACEYAEDKVLAHEMKQVIIRAINSLNEEQRYVFVETEIKGRSYEELAAESGEKLGTLLSRKHRAIKKLKILIREYMI